MSDTSEFAAPAIIQPRIGWSDTKCSLFKEQFLEFLSYVRVDSKELGNICLGDHVYRSQMIFLDGTMEALSRDVHDIKCGKSRQLGISTFSRALSLFWNGIHDGLKGYMVFDTGQHVEEARLELVSMIRSLPDKVRFPRIERENRGLIRLKNGSGFSFASAGTRPGKSSGTLGRSPGINFVHCSEVCSWDNVEGLEAFRNALAEDFPDRLYIWESTARGFNAWHDMWKEALADSDHQKTIFIGWWAKDNQTIARHHPDFRRYGEQPPSQIELKKIHEVRDLYGWNVTPEQLAWYRRKVDPTAQPDGDAPAEFEAGPLRIQEQPWCVVAGTRVGTDLGILRICDIFAGLDTALGRVQAAMPTGVSEIWQAKTKLGYEIEGTGNHPIINTDGDEVDLSKSLGSSVRLQPPKFADEEYTFRWRQGIVEHSIRITPVFARLLGFFMGDGSMSGQAKEGSSHVLGIACDAKDQDVVQECVRLIDDVFGVKASVSTYAPRGVGSCTNVRASSRLIHDVFDAMGLLRRVPNVKRKVHVPEAIFRSPRHVVREFLRGLFEADGFNGYETHRVAFFSKWPEFIKHVQLLLLGFGITSKLSIEDKVHKKTGQKFTGRALSLRASEARSFNEQIGFVSARKIARNIKPPRIRKRIRDKERQAPPIVMQDVVISVEKTDRIEEVFNLTVSGNHWFDANGIVTHNTADDMFQMTGATFFEPSKLTEIANKNVSKKFKTYSYIPGLEFSDMRIFPAHNARSVELKVWEEPLPDCIYVISADPAFGYNEKNDRSAIQVMRCYADGMDQVAEYAWPLINSNHFAWVIASLLGWYGDMENNEVYFILELNGPGDAVWRSLQGLKHQLQHGYATKSVTEKGLESVFINVRNYIYGRADAMGPGRAWHLKTTGPLKVSLMERLRDFVTANMITIRSQDTLEEMKSITREGDTIEAQGSKKDDRVAAMAFAVRAWEERPRRLMVTLKRTRENEAAKHRMTIKDQVMLFNGNHLETFFKAKNTQRNRDAHAINRMRWRGRR